MIKTVPKTSKDNYISGFYSLNTPYEDRETADWHPMTYWYTPDDKPCEILLYKPNELLGCQGIEYRNIMWTDEKVYISNFPRALCDLLFERNIPSMLRYSKQDFLMREDDQKEYFGMLMKIYKADIYDDFGVLVMNNLYPIEFSRWLIDETRRLAKNKG